MSSSSSSSFSESPEADELIPSLPNDVTLNCLTRLPSNHLPTLSLVSKPIRSLLSSPHFFNQRRFLHSSEIITYFFLHNGTTNEWQWFSLYLNPTNSTAVQVSSLPPMPSSLDSATESAFAVLGHKIYVIGGSKGGVPSAEVWVLDCRFNRWERGPTMLAARKNICANVVHGKIYVIGGSTSSSICGEVLDPEVGNNKWVELPCTMDHITREQEKIITAVMDDEKVYMLSHGHGAVRFDPMNGVWEKIRGKSFYVGYVFMDGIFYSWGPRGLFGFDVREKGKVVKKELKYLDHVIIPPMTEDLQFPIAVDAGDDGKSLLLIWACDDGGPDKRYLVRSSSDQSRY
ncbi:hypothetical protein RIF29_12420 [Crotalaria pallida]|uniref:F-box domain-containing protein n=1 Tax=Crotalaria pallida TaxID=3830 RepID=A0AAN9IN48_CROPI